MSPDPLPDLSERIAQAMADYENEHRYELDNGYQSTGVEPYEHGACDFEKIAAFVAEKLAPAPVPGDGQDTRDTCPTCGAVVIVRSADEGTSHYTAACSTGEVERLRAALTEIATRTYDTQYDDALPHVVKFAGRIHAVARAALEPAPASDENGERDA